MAYRLPLNVWFEEASQMLLLENGEYNSILLTIITNPWTETETRQVFTIANFRRERIAEFFSLKTKHPE